MVASTCRTGSDRTSPLNLCRPISSSLKREAMTNARRAAAARYTLGGYSCRARTSTDRNELTTRENAIISRQVDRDRASINPSAPHVGKRGARMLILRQMLNTPLGSHLSFGYYLAVTATNVHGKTLPPPSRQVENALIAGVRSTLGRRIERGNNASIYASWFRRFYRCVLPVVQ